MITCISDMKLATTVSFGDMTFEDSAFERFECILRMFKHINWLKIFYVRILHIIYCNFDFPSPTYLPTLLMMHRHIWSVVGRCSKIGDCK